MHIITVLSTQFLLPMFDDQKVLHFNWTSRIPDPSSKARLLEAVTRMERKSFPTGERLDFEAELKKQNTTLYCLLRDWSKDAEVMAYMVCARVGRKALLHKVCVQEGYRRRAIGSAMIKELQQDLISSVCEELELWVDENRLPARALYSRLRFREIQRLENYYGPGRTGLKMSLELSVEQRPGSIH
ncbi:MAG: hypothetical protein M1816_002910 [Peltula sp. TS41687]|nr:MAG: hypothetical protein M1816_002910 [Peltula sp. TS41687]